MQLPANSAEVFTRNLSVVFISEFNPKSRADSSAKVISRVFYSPNAGRQTDKRRMELADIIPDSTVESMWRRKVQALCGEANGALPLSSDLTSVHAVRPQGELLAASGGWH